MNRAVVELLVRVVLVVSIYAFVGNSGIVSFGHVGFMAIGAYAMAWQTLPLFLKKSSMPGLPELLLNASVPFPIALLFSAILAAFVAAAIGTVILRLPAIAASISTFAFLMIVHSVYSNWEGVTGGTSSVVGIPTKVNLWVALAGAAACIVVTGFYQTTRYGLALKCSREEEIAARAAGINIFKQRLLAFILSGFLMGLGGALYAGFLGAIYIDAFYLSQTTMLLAMLVVGGMSSLTGAVGGAVVISLLTYLLRGLERGIHVGPQTIALPSGTQEVVLGIVMIIALISFRSGIFGTREIAQWIPRVRTELVSKAHYQPTND
ncbi:branched-chain amino acid ABC transporter permease (plasmid) [Mesorhizobium sp. 131-3-5]|nr:branched-chain amino acid ABC transporter permease [Mesorhizobium sp. 131-3-5]